MNHYPHHLGDYAKDTLGFSALDHGVYCLLLHAYYASEQAPAADEVEDVAKVKTAADRKALTKVLKKFELREGRYYHKRVEQEIDAYRERAEIARENGKRGGRRQNPSGNPVGTQSGSPSANPSGTRVGNPVGGQTGDPSGGPSGKLAINHKPEPLSTALPDRDIPAPAREKAVESEPQVNPPHVAGIVAECERAHLDDASTSNPIIARWIERRYTTSQVAKALIDARRSMPFPAHLDAGYVDPILVRIVNVDRKAREAAGKRIADTKALITEQQQREVSEAPEAIFEQFKRPRRESA